MLLWRTQLLLLLISVMQHLYRGLVPALRHSVHVTVALHHLGRNTVKVVLYSSYSNGGDRNGDGYDRNGRGDRHRRPKDIINTIPGVDAGNFPRSPRIVDNNPRREGVDGNRRTSSFVKTDSTRDISSNFRQRVSGSSFDEVRPRGGQSYRGTTGGERASYDRKPRSNEYVDDDGTGEERFPDRRYELRYDRDDNREPAYGYYDGDHLYGIAPVRLALLAGKREMKELLVQEGMDLSNKKDSKAAKEILQVAQTRGIDIREFSKHDLNMLTDNRPHQGFVLRAMPLQFTRLAHLDPVDQYSCVLALDEVWDPQNFGALLRTSYFLKCDKVVVCAKNSAPLSPVVSKASAGALEVMEVYSTDNLMKFLDKSRDNGWQIVGTDLGTRSISLFDVPRTVPTVLVLGNEGHGIRTNILRRCTHLVRIGGGNSGAAAAVSNELAHMSVDATEGSSTDGEEATDGLLPGVTAAAHEDAVDSLNVSVTGAIILHHFLSTA